MWEHIYKREAAAARSADRLLKENDLPKLSFMHKLSQKKIEKVKLGKLTIKFQNIQQVYCERIWMQKLTYKKAINF